jgi:hypothetical protein
VVAVHLEKGRFSTHRGPFEEDHIRQFIQSLMTGSNYTRNECGRCKTTLGTGVEDVKLHSERVWKMTDYNQKRWGRRKTLTKRDEISGRAALDVLPKELVTIKKTRKWDGKDAPREEEEL